MRERLLGRDASPLAQDSALAVLLAVLGAVLVALAPAEVRGTDWPARIAYDTPAMLGNLRVD